MISDRLKKRDIPLGKGMNASSLSAAMGKISGKDLTIITVCIHAAGDLL